MDDAPTGTARTLIIYNLKEYSNSASINVDLNAIDIIN